ncbi:hypothetical protein LOCC1_G000671 [Lachnellula occidentalis]|uniref:Mitochondrial protein M19 n=1 Tax=Lachnellula occidentalis TaxID=215460 RepID=A0A8H8S8M4_9HELO|nr:hypothetical protein LOCC1_G000671 [Lachnellula occidentalis]
MSSSVAYKHYIRALSRWPKDALRPDCQFQDVIRRRVDKRFLPVEGQKPADEKAELEEVNALYSLLGNRYAQKYRITGDLMKPQSNPTHYTDLIHEMEAVPNRTWWGNMTNRWKGFLRFK